MAPAALPLAKAAADLVKTRVAGRQQSFHAKLGGRLQKRTAAGLGIDVRFGGGGRDADRGFDFEVVGGVKERAHGLQPPGAKFEGGGEGCLTHV